MAQVPRAARRTQGWRQDGQRALSSLGSRDHKDQRYEGWGAVRGPGGLSVGPVTIDPVDGLQINRSWVSLPGFRCSLFYLFGFFFLVCLFILIFSFNFIGA